MGNNLVKLTACLGLLVLLTLQSCKPTCDLGYEGNHCTTPVRNKFLGAFMGNQTCGATTDTCTLTFSEVAGDITKLRIRNINGRGINSTATTLDDGSLTIGSQNFAGANITGTVSYDGKITVTYIISGSGVADSSCTWQQN